MPIATFDDASDQYLENLSYEREGSTAKAWLFIEACRAMLILFPKRSKAGENEVEFDASRLTREIEEARQWVGNNPNSSVAASTVRFPDFAEFRG